MARLRPAHLALLLPLALVAVWAVERGRTSREDPADVLHALRAADGPTLPDAGAAAAAARSETAAYDRETLYEYIDGAADAYLARGFERCLVATYSFAAGAGPAVDIEAEASRFAAPDGALAQMVSDRPAGASPVPGIPDAFADATVLVAVRGRDVLKLTALSADPAAGRALAALAAAWRGRR